MVRGTCVCGRGLQLCIGAVAWQCPHTSPTPRAGTTTTLWQRAPHSVVAMWRAGMLGTDPPSPVRCIPLSIRVGCGSMACRLGGKPLCRPSHPGSHWWCEPRRAGVHARRCKLHAAPRCSSTPTSVAAAARRALLSTASHSAWRGGQACPGCMRMGGVGTALLTRPPHTSGCAGLLGTWHRHGEDAHPSSTTQMADWCVAQPPAHVLFEGARCPHRNQPWSPPSIVPVRGAAHTEVSGVRVWWSGWTCHRAWHMLGLRGVMCVRM